MTNSLNTNTIFTGAFLGAMVWEVECADWILVMEKLLLALAAVSLEGAVGVTDPVEEGDTVLGVLDPQQRQLFLLLDVATSKLAAAKKKGGEAIAVATSEGDILRAKAALRDELTPLELEEKTLRQIFWGTVLYQYQGVSRDCGVALRENWQVVSFKPNMVQGLRVLFARWGMPV